jgi:thiamine-monophosphate kinase
VACGLVLNPDSSLGEVGERALLKHIRSRIPLGPGVVVGVGDDAAAVQTAALTLVTTDTLVEGAHFRRDWTPPQLLGRKALTISLSDIAAMAGIPRYATVSLCLPPDLPLRFVDELYDGLLERAAETGVSLIGGNLAACREAISIEVMVLGQGDKLLRRSGAQSGDLAVVTGTLGASAAGLRLLKQGARLGAEGGLEATGIWTESSAPGLTHCLMAHLDPSPPLAFARALSEHELVHAAMDISDGLSGDLLHLCEESSVAAWLDPAALPIDPWAARVERARGGDSLALALHGGEDYQLLLAVPPDRLDALKDVAVVWDLPLAAVGQFTEGEPAVSIRNGELVQPLEVAGFDHFRTAAAERRASPEAGA